MTIHVEFTADELKYRAFLRLSTFLHSLWEEKPDYKGSKCDTRLFHEPMIPDGLVTRGASRRALETGAKTRGEHAVPRAYLQKIVWDLFNSGKTREEVARELQRLIRIVTIHREEASHVDNVLKFKKTMPPGWDPDTGDVVARLTAARIEIIDD